MGTTTGDVQFNNNDFDLCFEKVDKDNSGQIDKKEMLKFLQIVKN